MSGPRDQSVRSPAVAGMFYPADAAACRRAATSLLESARPAISQMSSQLGNESGVGAIVPHAGWICSGAVAAESIVSLARQRPVVDLVVVFGAIHTPIPIDRGVLDSHARWAVPGGESGVTDLRRELSANGSQFVTDDRFHLREHAVEVELPLIQATWPLAQILPIEVPPDDSAVELGRSVARTVKAAGVSAIYLASSDLTHYGPNYRFAPAGVGAAAMEWAMENDRRVLRIITDMTPEKIASEARSHNNACGAGAIAAMMAACLEQGARKAVLLRHTSSYQTLAAVAPQTPDNAVGYAAVWVG
jgi:MEMO1 family protein